MSVEHGGDKSPMCFENSLLRNVVHLVSVLFGVVGMFVFARSTNVLKYVASTSLRDDRVRNTGASQ